MKTKTYLAHLLLLGIFCGLSSVRAEVPVTTVVTEGHKLPYGAQDVLKLSHAQVNEDIIVSYIQNSGTVYNLEAVDIVYLKEQGVSDRIVNAMVEQRRRVGEVAAAQTAAQSQATQAQAPNTAVTAPLTPVSNGYSSGASTVYTIPYPQATYAYYSYPYYYGYPYYYRYPYYGYYGCYGYPSVAFSFGYGGYYGRYYGHGSYAHGSYAHGSYGHGGSYAHGGGGGGHGGSFAHGGGGHGGHR